jgi:hypothetical protein
VVMTKQQFLQRLREEWNHLLDPHATLNLCFFFECAHSFDEYNCANTNHFLDDLGPLAPTRWEHMKEIHVLFPSKVGHIYCARRADLPHYQEMFWKFASNLSAYENPLSVYIYCKGEDYSNHFLTVRNSPSQVLPFVEQLDWLEIHRIASLPPKKPTGKGAKRALETRRATIFHDT